MSAPISIVVSSLGASPRLAATLESLGAQEHPGLEVVVADCASGEGAALNKAFAGTRGEILGYLAAGDTLEPGVLHRVAREIDPARGRFVVAGRCRFTGADLRSAKVEFPVRYAGHFELLAIWKRGFSELPRPSVFWHRRAWARSGGFDEHLRHALDYDLFCRFSRDFGIRTVDDGWGAVPVDEGLRPGECTESELLALSIACSRRYWGGWLSPLRWRCEASYRRYARHGHDRARHHARRAEAAVRDGRLAEALGELMQTLRYSPSMASERLVRRWLKTGRRLVSERFSR